MPRISKVSRSKAILGTASITSASYLDFLRPWASCTRQRDGTYGRSYHSSAPKKDLERFESAFFSALSRAASCPAHQIRRPHGRVKPTSTRQWSTAGYSAPARTERNMHGTSALKFSNQPVGEGIVRGQNGPSWTDIGQHTEHGKSVQRARRSKKSDFFQPSFAAKSRLPKAFYDDLKNLQMTIVSKDMVDCSEEGGDSEKHSSDSSVNLQDQLMLLKAVRDLEEKLAKAKADLHRSLDRRKADVSHPQKRGTPRVVLTKEDYLNLVDLYFYSHQSRFEPDSPDYSPTPLFLDDYSFKLSADFSKSDAEPEYEDEERDEDISPLKQVEEMLKSRQLHEISLMRAFIELLLDDTSSNKALFETYKRFPNPGVASLPQGVIRLFLQRMSTPWVKSEKTMLRYLSLIDDMQRASLPITSAEWSSAIYLAGRSFSTVTESEVATSFRIWREMEQEAGVKANHVTFNILFDIAVRAGKYALGQTILKEMHDRGLRLNRLGRVSLIYYHGLRGDGDGVRKAYRDFVEAGEIVDTLVLNCVMASLINAQEPVAAEQVYERMKNLQARLQKGQREEGEEGLFMKYPPPGSSQINMEMASNSLGRILLRAAHLRNVLPEHHAELQHSMPLTPDPTTFRTMIAHHASTSGDLDRLTVLINDMTEVFELPLQSVNFQLLLKGFAIHGASRSEQSMWTLKRLELVWTACREAIKGGWVERESSHDRTAHDLNIPTIQEVDAETAAEARVQALLPARPINKGPKKLGAWDEFVLDLAAFPRERLKPIHERKAPIGQDDEENPFASPSFPSDSDLNADSAITSTSAQTVPLNDGDEYTLPSAIFHSHPNQAPEQDLDSDSPSLPDASVRATQPLVMWLLRAYQRVTNSRRKVEEVWFQLRKVWRPADAMERDAVVRVLRRALRDCDRMGGA